MRIGLLCVGAPRQRELAHLHDDYAERIRRLRVEYSAAHVPEVRPGSYADDHVLEREARGLQKKIGAGTLVALDRTGLALDSAGVAERLERWAAPRLTLVIGGPLGLHRSVSERADARWSLSPLTLPHELVRVIVAEQVYRALTILRRIPYHK